MMDSEKQNGTGTEETDGRPAEDTSNNATPVPSSIIGEVPNDTELNNTKTTQSTKMSTGELENCSSNGETTKDNYLSLPNTESSNSVPLLPSSESPLPSVITLTPDTQETFESDSTKYLHFYMDYNSDGTITAYQIYPCDSESPAVDCQSQSQLPKVRVSLGSDPSEFQLYQFQDPAAMSQAFAQNSVPESRNDESLCQALSQVIADEFQKYTPNSYPVFQETLEDIPVYQDVHNNAPAYQDVRGNPPMYQWVHNNAPVYPDVQISSPLHQDVPINAPLYQDVPINAPLYQDVPINSPLYQDVHSNIPLYQYAQNNAPLTQDAQSKAPVHHDIQSNSITGQRVYNNESDFEEHPDPAFGQHQEANPSFTSWRGRHAAMESKVVAAVRAVAWGNPKFIKLFQNRDKRFHRNRNPGVKVETDIPVSEIHLPSNRMSTTLNELSLSRASLQVETQTTNSSILKDPIPVGHTFTESSAILLPKEDSSPVENLFGTFEHFDTNALVSEIPSPKNTPEVILPSAVSQLNSTQPLLNFSISEIPLSFDDGSTGRLHEDCNTLSSTVSREKSAENYELNFPVSEISLPLDPICKNSEILNKLLIADSSVFVPNNSPTDQASGTGHDKTRTELKFTFLQESVLKIPKESIDSEFAEKCRIFRDQLTENLDLNVNNKDTQNYLHKTHKQSRTEKISMNKDKSDILSSTSNNLQDKQKNPNIFEQESSTLFNSKCASFQSKLQADLKSIKQNMPSKSSIVDTEIIPRQETENKRPTQLKNISTSRNVDKENDMKKIIFDDIEKEINNSELEIEKSKLLMTNESLKTSESEIGSNRSLSLPKVDIKSEMDKIIPKSRPIDSKVKKDRIILKPISRKKEASHSHLRIAASENKTGVPSNRASTKTKIDVTSDSASTKTKIDIPKIQITDHDRTILPNAARAESRQKADISPKDAKANLAFLKPNTKKGMEHISFSENCVALSGPTAFVESGAARKTTPKKNVSPQNLPPEVIRTLLEKSSEMTVQRFLEEQTPGSEGPKQELFLSEDTAEIQDLVERKPKIEAAENESVETTPKSSKSRKRRSKNVIESPAEKDSKRFFEPDVTG